MPLALGITGVKTSRVGGKVRWFGAALELV
jgi:hypothetical protein